VSNAVLDFLSKRASAPINELKEPGPNDDQLARLMQLAMRVPDHGRLTPWRFIIYRGDVRFGVGEKLAAIAEKREGPLSDVRLEQERTRFSRAPLVIGVVCTPKPNPKIPEWEMFLSAGASAMMLVVAANAMGFHTNWITNWYSGDPEALEMLGVGPSERIVGFVHIGTFSGEIVPRPRPEPSAHYSDYAGPWKHDHVL
jgi:nitroreductase